VYTIVRELSSMGEEKNKELIRKYKPLTKAEIVQRFKAMKEMRKDMTTDAATLEKNLVAFNDTVDPLVDPETGKCLCWVRRPTTKELEDLIPSELMEYRNTPDKVPAKIMKKYENFQFKMMAKLIEKPKKSAEWWKEHANLVFQHLFQVHLNSVMQDLGITAENF